VLNRSTSNTKPVLSKEASDLLVRVIKKPLALYWGRNGWCPSNLPKGVKRAHFDELTKSGKVKVEMANLIPTEAPER
jgi:hypothetical protein